MRVRRVSLGGLARVERRALLGALLRLGGGGLLTGRLTLRFLLRALGRERLGRLGGDGLAPLLERGGLGRKPRLSSGAHEARS